ncbi:MAG: copper resistance protein CopC [Chloroflexota bacterium]|nr:copper resistance protein CopC [Chloroflexota bacterium]
MNKSIRTLVAMFLGIGLFFVAISTASAHNAHAKVNTATPAIGSTIAQAPATVTVETLENMNPNPKLSNLVVYGPGGDLISQGDAKVSLTNPKEMSVAIKGNGNGVYIVRWITVSADDGDPDQGAFVFTVKPTAAATPTATNGGTTTTNTSGTSGTPVWVPILVGIVALLIGAGAGLGIGRSMAKPSSLGSMRQTVAAQQQKDEATNKRP